MENEQDAIVVGGGSAGSFCAYELAKRHVSVTVFEEHKEIGEPSHCAGHLSIRSLSTLGLYPPADGVLENTFSAANFYSSQGSKLSIHLKQPVTCALNRANFDKYLSKMAERQGAKIQLDTRVQSLLKKDGIVCGVNIIKEGEERQVHSKIIVDAEGISSRLMHQAGLQTLKAQCLVYAIETVMENVKDMEEHAVEVYLGKEYAPGFYGWLIPLRDGTAKVGLATKYGNPKVFFERLKRKHPVASKQLKEARLKKMSFHAISLGGLVPKNYTNGFLAVGDCASQVKPTTGGGVIFSITSAKIAAEVASKAIKESNQNEENLSEYQEQVEKKLQFDISVMLRARKALNALSDEKIDRAIRFAQKVGIDNSLSDIDEIDFQGQTLFKILAKPRAYAALAYLLKLYLPEIARNGVY